MSILGIANYVQNAIISAVGNCIEGVSIGDDNNKATWRIDFNSDATIEQRTSAQAVLNSLDYNAYVQGATMRQDDIKNDALRTDLIDRLKSSTNDQIDNWIDNNVNSLASARQVLKAIVKVLVFLINE